MTTTSPNNNENNTNNANNEQLKAANSPASWIGAIIFVIFVLFAFNYCSNHTDTSKSVQQSTHSDALIACKRAAEDYYPMGFDYSTLDVTMTEIGGEPRIIFNEATVVNALGQKQKVRIHCQTENGEVTNFSAQDL